jgi:hypothetical protein
MENQRRWRRQKLATMMTSDFPALAGDFRRRWRMNCERVHMQEEVKTQKMVYEN